MATVLLLLLRVLLAHARGCSLSGGYERLDDYVTKGRERWTQSERSYEERRYHSVEPQRSRNCFEQESAFSDSAYPRWFGQSWVSVWS